VAEQSRQRHKILYDFLTAIGVSEEAADADSEGMEHHCSEETLALTYPPDRAASAKADPLSSGRQRLDLGEEVAWGGLLLPGPLERSAARSYRRASFGKERRPAPCEASEPVPVAAAE
jgi:hypothetical protein